MNISLLEFDIVPNDVQQPLGVEVWFNKQCLLDLNRVVDIVHLQQEISDFPEQQRTIKIVLKNKTAQHTQVNEKLEIVSDSVIEVKNFKLAEVEIDQALRDQAVYSHNFNSNSDYSDHKFYNTMGCNGVVKFEISTPAYIWLLEHM